MATPGNTPTTDSAVLLAIVDKINDADSVNDHVVSITAESFFQGVAYAGDHYIQLVPGAAVDRKGVGVDDGLLQTEFRVVFYKRLMTDMADQDTQRITHATLGLFKLIADVDAQLINSMLGGLTLTPIVPVRRAPVQSPPVSNSGWTAAERLYTVTYKVSYPEIQDQ